MTHDCKLNEGLISMTWYLPHRKVKRLKSSNDGLLSGDRAITEVKGGAQRQLDNDSRAQYMGFIHLFLKQRGINEVEGGRREKREMV